MKKFLLVCFVTAITLTSVFSQVPQAFHYQAIARDEAGNPLINKDIGLRISILQHDQSGPVIYSEIHRVQTGPLGLINLNVGQGSIVYGRFSDIDWAGDTYSLMLEMDAHGGTNYRSVGVSGLYSVPYALCAGSLTGGGSRTGEWTNDGTDIYVSASYSANNVCIGTTSPSQKLHLFNGSGVTNLLVEGYCSGMNGGISNLYLKNNSGGALFGFFFKKESSNTVAVLSAYDGSSWIAFNKLNFATKELEYQSGVVDVKFSNSGKVLLNGTGNVGIGMLTPGYKLDVAGNVNATGFYKSGVLFKEGKWSGTTDIYYTGGNVGIGTTGPVEFVHIYKSSATTNPKLLLENPGSGDASMAFKNVTTQNTMGLDYNDDSNFEISNTGTLTGSGGSDYTDANTMMRINRTNAGIVDINHQSRARAYLSDTTGVMGPTYIDYYGRGWFKIPFDKNSPVPGFDEHNEFSNATSQFTALEEGYYQVNARSEIIAIETMWEYARSRNYIPPFSVVFSIGIFVNGQLYAQGNNYELNYLTPGGEFMYYEYMNAPNVSDVLNLIPGDYVEVCLLIFSPIMMPPFPCMITIVGDDYGVFSYVSIHKVS